MCRICSNCNSNKTRKVKAINGKFYDSWFKYNGGYICLKCYMKLIHHPRYYKNNRDRIIDNGKKWYEENHDKPEVIERIKRWNSRKMIFKRKQIYVKENPRIGVCNLCRAVVPFDCKVTNIHHIAYHEEDPLKDTIELCARCHGKANWELINQLI